MSRSDLAPPAIFLGFHMWTKITCDGRPAFRRLAFGGLDRYYYARPGSPQPCAADVHGHRQRGELGVPRQTGICSYVSCSWGSRVLSAYPLHERDMTANLQAFPAICTQNTACVRLHHRMGVTTGGLSLCTMMTFGPVQAYAAAGVFYLTPDGGTT